ncbi:hypothetical protein ACIOKA_37935 [Streptomyces anulatus]
MSNSDPSITGRIAPDSVTAPRIADGAVETGNVMDDIRNEEPWMVEAIIVRALAEFSLGGSPMGKQEAERWLGLYRQNVLGSVQP